MDAEVVLSVVRQPQPRFEPKARTSSSVVSRDAVELWLDGPCVYVRCESLKCCLKALKRAGVDSREGRLLRISATTNPSAVIVEDFALRLGLSFPAFLVRLCTLIYKDSPVCGLFCELTTGRHQDIGVEPDEPVYFCNQLVELLSGVANTILF